MFLSSDNNDITIETYRKSFDIYEEKTPNVVSGEFKEWIDFFLSFLSPDALILEIGSATGRDARYFRSLGYSVVCTDVIPLALEKLLEQGFEVEQFDFRDKPNAEWENCFDAVFANAVFVHASYEIFRNFLLNISFCLKSGGIIAFSLKNGEGEEMTKEKVGDFRYFKYYLEEELLKMFLEVPFELVRISYADDKKWIHVVARLK